MRASALVLFSRLTNKARVRHLQLLTAIGDLGNLQKAAAAVGMSQPAATHALAELEALVELPLFERHARGMRPTPVAAAVLPLLKNAMRSLQQCAEIVAAMGSGTSSSVRVGAIGAATNALLASALPDFSTAHPEVMVDVVQLTPEDLMSALGQGSIDMALCRQPGFVAELFEFVPILSDRYAVICGAEHPLAGQRVEDIDTLADYTWLMPPQTGIAGTHFARLWDERGKAPEVCWVTSRSPNVLWAMLQQRELLVLLPVNVAHMHLQAGLFAEVHGPWHMPLPPLGAVVRKEERQGRSATAALLAELQHWSDLAP